MLDQETTLRIHALHILIVRRTSSGGTQASISSSITHCGKVPSKPPCGRILERISLVRMPPQAVGFMRSWSNAVSAAALAAVRSLSAGISVNRFALLPNVPAKQHILKVEPRGFEPLTSAVQRRSDSVAGVRRCSNASKQCAFPPVSRRACSRTFARVGVGVGVNRRRLRDACGIDHTC